MNLVKQHTSHQFLMLTDFLERVSPSLYQQPLEALGNSTIGMHVRHLIEYYQCLLLPNSEDTIAYDLRKRDLELEQDCILAAKVLKAVDLALADLPLPQTCKVDYSFTLGENSVVTSTYERELVYCLDHAIHHMAQIKMVMKTVASNFSLHNDFGIAISTLVYQQACVR